MLSYQPSAAAVAPEKILSIELERSVVYGPSFSARRRIADGGLVFNSAAFFGNSHPLKTSGGVPPCMISGYLRDGSVSGGNSVRSIGGISARP